MREIKFRVWDSISNTLHPWDKVELEFLCVFVDLDRYTLMQYTGLKDKNGVEIYEGDITELGVVGWNGINGHWEYQHNDGEPKMFPICEIEIIGNIHENPELLK